MTNDEFKDLFGEDEVLELEQAAAAAEAEAAEKAPVATVKDGLWYAEDSVDANGHTISWYALNASGKTLLWISVDNALEIGAELLSNAAHGHVPAGVTGHAIRVHNATRTVSVETSGIAVRAPHEDGTHVDGQTIRSYVVPRVSRWIAQFYGI